MKKLLTACLLTGVFCLFSGCSNPNAHQLDLSRGYGEQLKLIHLNGSSTEKLERMEEFAQVIRDARPLEKDSSMFAYYPDYLLEITPWEDGSLTVLVDINGDFVDFIYPSPTPEQDGIVYRSGVTAEEFRILIHKA